MKLETFFIFNWTDLPEPLKEKVAEDYYISNDSLYRVYNEGENEELSKWLDEQGIPRGIQCLMEVCY